MITKADFAAIGLVTTSEPIRLDSERYCVELESQDFSVDLAALLAMFQGEGSVVRLEFEPSQVWDSCCNPESIRVTWAAA